MQPSDQTVKLQNIANCDFAFWKRRAVAAASRPAIAFVRRYVIAPSVLELDGPDEPTGLVLSNFADFHSRM